MGAKKRSRRKVPRRLEGIQVLVVDDDSPSAKLHAVTLEEHGAVVTIAGHMLAARAVLANVAPRIIVLDRLLPDGDGLDLAREVSARHGSDIGIVLVSSLNGHAAEMEARGAGCSHYFRKPIDIDVLVDAVEATVRGRPS